jgi:hypothetical protein
MKNRRVFAGILIIILLALFTNWAFRHRPSRPLPPGQGEAATRQNPIEPGPPAHDSSSERATVSAATAQMPDTNGMNAHQAEMERRSIEVFKTPIDFYGKVVDENSDPLAGADIRFSWNRLSISNTLETGQTAAASDENGLFSLEGQNGEGLDVRVTKSGYYNVRSNAMSFQFSQFSGMHVYVPDRISPVIFVLRKKGNGASLVTSKLGMSDDFAVPVPRDGIPMKVDLLNRKTGEGPLEIAQTKPEPKLMNAAKEWSFKMTIPGGGFIEYQNQDFPFEAPDVGYQSTMQFNFQRGEADWTEAISKDFFIRFADPPIYGRMHVETSIGGGVRLTYAINPDGSRNLESR